MITFLRQRACWLVAAAIFLVACQPTALTGPLGKITLRYDGATDSNLFFVLENRTDHEIHFRGTRRFWGHTKPALADIQCGSDGPRVIYNLFGLDGFKIFEPGVIHLSPDERVRLSLDGENRAKGLTCRLSISIDLDTKLNFISDEFQT
jgi:hypothetical protein